MSASSASSSASLLSLPLPSRLRGIQNMPNVSVMEDSDTGVEWIDPVLKG